MRRRVTIILTFRTGAEQTGGDVVESGAEGNILVKGLDVVKTGAKLVDRNAGKLNAGTGWLMRHTVRLILL